MVENCLANRYQLINPLGKGGFAQTYLAADQHHDGTICVIKQLMPANPSKEFLETARRLFKSEVEVLRRLGNHNRIPTLLDAFEDNGEFYLVQEYIEGESLEDLFKQRTFSEADILDLLKDVLPTLAFIHQEQVVHRDIKPSNLIRRQADGKIVLIDFGAVKEITTEFYTGESEQFTISIGTQGYAAPEQMAGRPRYSSDLYSLGMTVIRGLTGKSPTEIPENPHTGEIQWPAEAPDVSPETTAFLQKLTQVSVYRRYASANEAIAALAQPQASASSEAFEDVPETEIGQIKGPDPRRNGHRWKGILTPVVTTVIVLLIRQLGGWAPLELWVFDWWTRQKPAPPTDDRILVVEITEPDLQALQQPTPSDAVLAEAIQALQSHAPRAIGLDLYRDLPQGEGHVDLLQALSADNAIAINQLGDDASGRVPAPRGIPDERVGFNDFPIDKDGVVRRGLLFASPNEAEAEGQYSFALRLALVYLASQDVVPLRSDQNPDFLALNGVTFSPLHTRFGGYHTVDDAGYQFMLQYRGADGAFATLSLGDLLEGNFDATLIRDRIVLIGTTAASAKDFFLTPYSTTSDQDFLMAGVVLHAHATSQILSAALEGRPLYWDFPEAIEIGWIVVGAAGGYLLAAKSKGLGILVIGLMGGSVALGGIAVGVFTLSGWLPIAATGAAFWGSAIATALTKNNGTLLAGFQPNPSP